MQAAIRGGQSALLGDTLALCCLEELACHSLSREGQVWPAVSRAMADLGPWTALCCLGLLVYVLVSAQAHRIKMQGRGLLEMTSPSSSFYRSGQPVRTCQWQHPRGADTTRPASGGL